MSFSRLRLLPLVIGVPLLLTACSVQSTVDASAGGDANGCVTDYTEGKDYFPDKTQLSYAKNFTVTYHDSYQVLEVKQSFQGGPAEKYVLFRCGTPAPEATGDLAGAQQIEVPIDSIFSGSTTHLPLLDALDEMPSLTGVSNASYVTNEAARQRIEDGKAVEYAANQSIDTELVISSKPDLLMTGGTDDPAYQVLKGNGIKVVANAEWLEETPLGRAEWVKYLAAFTGDEDKAAKVFDQIETDYQAVAATAEKSGTPVSVLPGQMFNGVWYMPAGDSYVAAMIDDANATYAWADTPGTGSVQLSLEEVLSKGRDAEVWLMSSDVQTLADVTADDPRYAEFTAFTKKAVWSNNARIGPGGGNDYWETGVTRPDLVLADLVKVLHPDVQLDHQLVFYRQLGQ